MTHEQYIRKYLRFTISACRSDHNRHRHLSTLTNEQENITHTRPCMMRLLVIFIYSMIWRSPAIHSETEPPASRDNIITTDCNIMKVRRDLWSNKFRYKYNVATAINTRARAVEPQIQTFVLYHTDIRDIVCTSIYPNYVCCLKIHKHKYKRIWSSVFYISGIKTIESTVPHGGR